MCFKKELCIFTTGLTGHFLSYSDIDVPQKSTLTQFKLQPVLPVNLPAVLDTASRYFREQNMAFRRCLFCYCMEHAQPLPHRASRTHNKDRDRFWVAFCPLLNLRDPSAASYYCCNAASVHYEHLIQTLTLECYS